MPDSGRQSRLIRASAMVTEMAVLTLVGIFAGGWLDRRFGTSPLLFFLLSLLGFGGGMARLIRAVARLDQDESQPPKPR